MPDWRSYLTAPERDELAQIASTNRDLKAQYRRIYDRCRKRMKKGKADAPITEQDATHDR